MAPELAEQIAAQERFFAPLIVEPDGVTIQRDELAGVPVDIAPTFTAADKLAPAR